MATDPVLEPFEIKGVRLKNRILSTAHAPSYVEDGKPKLRYRLYHEEKARGGLAMTMFGGSTTTAVDSPSAFGQINAASDAVVPYFRELAQAVQRHDCRIMCQITHMGRRTCDDVADWLPTIAPSPVRERQHRSFPKEIEDHDIRRVLKGYADGARRCREGGLDGAEVIAWGHLLDQFLSPALNRRDDAYGGSIENRCRFALEVFQAIRDAVGPDFVVGIRMTGDEHVKDGREPEECVRIAEILAGSGLVDFFNVVGGTLGTDASVAYTIPSMGNRYGKFLELAGRIRKATGLPVFQAARIPDLATARWALEQGFVDMVGMTRAHIADPHIVAKLLRGDEQRIRPCVGMGYCIDRIYQGKDALCIHNAATGREATHAARGRAVRRPAAEGGHRRRRCRRDGGGPGGGVARPRGGAAGGHRPAGRPARAGGQGAGARGDHRHRRLAAGRSWSFLGVDIRLNTYAEPEDVLAESPDVVIVATGGLPDTSFLEEGQDLVHSVWDILGGYVEPEGTVLLYDDHGWHQGPSTAIALAKKGLEVEMVTPDRMIAFEVGATNYPNYLRDTYRHGVRLTPDLELHGVRREGNRLVARFWNEYSEETIEKPADHVVVEHGTMPADELYRALRDGSRNGGEVDLDGLVKGAPEEIVRNPDGGYFLYRIGDAVSSRNIHAAIYDALRLCKSL